MRLDAARTTLQEDVAALAAVARQETASTHIDSTPSASPRLCAALRYRAGWKQAAAQQRAMVGVLRVHVESVAALLTNSSAANGAGGEQLDAAAGPDASAADADELDSGFDAPAASSARSRAHRQQQCNLLMSLAQYAGAVFAQPKAPKLSSVRREDTLRCHRQNPPPPARQAQSIQH